MAAIALGGAVAASCDIDKRDVGPTGLGSDAGPAAGGSLGATGPRLEVTPPAVDLGWVTTGFAARARLTLRNTGDAPLPAPRIGWSTGSDPDFVVIQNLCEAEIAPGESCEVRVQVVPTRAGALTGTLEVRGSVGSADVGVAALGMQAGDLILAPATGSFEDYGGVLVGGVKESTFTLSNPGVTNTGPLHLGINRPEFALVAPGPGECVDDATALEPGQSCNVRLVFSPVARGLSDATLTAATEAAGSVSLTLAGRGLVPGVLDASLAGVDFEGVLLTQSARRSVTLSNGGDEPLELSGVSLAPADALGFTIANSTCAAATLLEAGTGCDVELEFRPPSVDVVLTAELVAAYVGAEQPLSVPLRGVGLQPGSLEVAPLTAGDDDFGDVLVGESLERAFQVVNPGAQASGALEWTIGEGFEVVAPSAAGDCAPGATSLVDGQVCTLRIRFSPPRREPMSGSLIITSPLAGAVSATVTGRGIIAGRLQADPELNFGRVLTAASAARTLTLRNVGDQLLPAPSLTVSSADPAQAAAFTFQSGCAEALALDQECTVDLTFAPAIAVPHAATLQVTSAPSAPASVLLLGEALVPGSLVLAAAAGSSAEFGDVAIGTSSSRSFTLTNPGAVSSGQLTITTDDNQFGVELGDCAAGDLVDGSSCTFSISFTPAASVAAAANVSVQSPGAGRAGIELSGRGRAKAALAATGNRDMGRANLGQAALTVPENEFTWTVNNTGDLATGALVVVNDNAQEFAVSADTCGGVELAGQASCSMLIRFSPAGTGPRTGRIGVTDPTGQSSAPIALTGLGVQLAGPGQSCVNAECQAGECTRTGVCCDTACDRACEVCSNSGVCTPLSGREPCGNGAACFGVDQCRLPEGAACTAQGGAAQCGSGFCQPRFGGTGDADRVCCLEVCGAGLACDGQGQCQQLTAGDGAVCGRPGDLPCGTNLTCTPCVGSGAGQSQCKPAGVCCGTCGAGLECVDGNSCGCPVGPNGLRGIPCAAGCAINQEGACCPEAPGCDPGLLCDANDNLCKECLSPADCQGRACQAGTCATAECTQGQRQCSNGVPQLCGANGLFDDEPACTGDLTCQTLTGQCGCTSGQACGNSCVDTTTSLSNCGGCGQPCSTQCIDSVCQPAAPARPLGAACPDGNCDEGVCSAGICCNRDCQAPCESCSTGTCQILETSSRCTCDFVAADAACTRPPPLALPAGAAVGSQCAADGQCAPFADRCPTSRGLGGSCIPASGGQGSCIGDVELGIFCQERLVGCAPSGTLDPLTCPGGDGSGSCCIAPTDQFRCSTFAGCGGDQQVQCDSDEDCLTGDVCCYFGDGNLANGGAVICSAAETCPSRLCSSPGGGANAECPPNQACLTLPATSDGAGWGFCGQF